MESKPREIIMAALNEEEEFEFRLRAEREAAPKYNSPRFTGMEHTASKDQVGELSGTELERALYKLKPAERLLVGAGSAAAKTGLGIKQLLLGGTLSPEDQQAVKDWSTIEQAAPLGAVTGNIATMVLPGAAMAKVPLLAGAGRAIVNPNTLGKAAAVGAGYMGLQPTEEQGAEGLQQRLIEAGKGAALAGVGYGALKGAAKLIRPKGTVIPASSIGSGAVEYIAPNADELARMEVLKNLPVPITEQDVIRSQLTRKYPQQEAERLVAGQPFIGEELSARLARGQEKMGLNIETLQAKTGAKAPSAEQAGNTVRTWMQNIYGAAKEDTNKAYQYAKQLHGDKQYIPQPEIINSLVENRAMPGYKELFAQAKNMGMIVEKKGGGFVGGKVTVNDLDKFKSMANQVAQSSDGTTRYAGGDIVNKVYSQLDDVAPEFRQAAALRKRQGMVFEDPKVTNKILGTVEGRFGAAEQKLGGATIPNYQVASEKLVDSISKGSIEDMRYLRKLAASGTFAQKREGVQAIREMRGNLIDGMKNVWDSTVTPQSKANQINKYFEKLGDEKIEILFGKAGAQKIADFRKAAEILNKSVPSPEGGSQTAGRLMMMGKGLFSVLEKIPVVGQTASGLAQGAKIMKDVGVARTAKDIPKIPSNLAALARRQEVSNRLAELAPYGALAGAGYE
jgi:hypothetical protein